MSTCVSLNPRRQKLEFGQLIVRKINVNIHSKWHQFLISNTVAQIIKF